MKVSPETEYALPGLAMSVESLSPETNASPAFANPAAVPWSPIDMLSPPLAEA